MDLTQSAEQQSAERFSRETAQHQMTVLHDDGLYRHLRFANPQYGGLYRYDLITWPNGLAIRGDGPNFVFALYPTADLFDMFRGSSHGGINPGYWQEKVLAGQVKAWSAGLFRTWLDATLQSAEQSTPGITSAFWQHMGLGEHDFEYEETARHTVETFEHNGRRLRFPAKWEHDFDGWSWEFLWACHAIVSGIAAYDREKAAAKCGTPHPVADEARCEREPGYDGYHAADVGAWPHIDLPFAARTTQEH